MGARQRRPRLVAIKFQMLAAGLTVLALVGYLNRKDVTSTIAGHGRFERSLASPDIPVALASSGCNCSSCFEPTDYAFTCCEKDSNLCLTAHHEVCSVEQLCAAEVCVHGCLVS